ncbi:MAG: 30S ribosomal protein S4 [Ardenticatenales bacterium]
MPRRRPLIARLDGEYGSHDCPPTCAHGGAQVESRDCCLTERPTQWGAPERCIAVMCEEIVTTMGRYTGPRNKLSRREGMDLFGNGGASLARRLEQIPGDHGRKPRRGRPSDFSRQLREKQKVKRIYGVRERQFRRVFDIARHEPEMTGVALLKRLERRLDSMLYRSGLARTRAMARQLVGHGHVTVNDRKVDIPSFIVEPGMTVGLHPTARKMTDVLWSIDSPVVMCPAWLSRDGFEVRVLDMPERSDIDAQIEENLIVEFYSR